MTTKLMWVLRSCERHTSAGPAFLFVKIAILIGLIVLAGWGVSSAQAGSEQRITYSLYRDNQQIDTPTADARVTKTDSNDPITLGGQIEYIITTTNYGPDPAQNVVITDTLPSGVSFNFATITQGSCSLAFPLIVCELGTLNPSDAVTLTIHVTPREAGTFTNGVEAASDTADPDISNNTDSETTTVVAPQADVSVTKSDDVDPVLFGSQIQYAVMVTNNGPDPAQSVVITDTLPSGVSFNYATITQGSCSLAFPLIVCELGTLNPADTVTLTIRVTPNSTGSFTNQVEIASNTEDPNTANNTDSETTTVTGYNFTGFLGAVKNPSTVNVAKAGSSIKLAFRLGGDQGLNIFAPGYPASTQVDCSSGTPLSLPEQTVSARTSILTYDLARDVYIYIWKTNRSWQGTCWEFILKLSDGSQHTALFQFR